MDVGRYYAERTVNGVNKMASLVLVLIECFCLAVTSR